MIITVTVNPAMDKTLEVQKLVPGGLNRITRVICDAGGKGINVSRTIKELGGESLATGFLRGTVGRMIGDVLEQTGIDCDFIFLEGETRTNIKVAEENGTVTELNESGPAILREQADMLIEKLLSYADEETLFVLSGSVPKGTDTSLYARIIRLVHEKGAKVLLDAEGELFAEAVRYKPDIVKPNLQELTAYYGKKGLLADEEILPAAERLKMEGIPLVVVSLGEKGALFLDEEGVIYAPALPVKVRSTVGAGDAMAAALALAWSRKSGREEMVRLAVASSAGAVMTAGTKPPDRELVRRLMEQTTCKYVKRDESIQTCGRAAPQA